MSIDTAPGGGANNAAARRRGARTSAPPSPPVHHPRDRDRALVIAYVAAAALACAGLSVSGATIALLLGVFHE